MKKEKKLITRLYRISEEMDKCVKKKAKLNGGESSYIRNLIVNDNGIASYPQK